MNSSRNIGRLSDSDRMSAAISDTDSLMSKEFDFAHVLEILRKFKWFIFLVTTIVMMAAAYYSLASIPVYRSTATLLVEAQKANVISIEEIYDVDDTNSEYYQTQIELLKSRELARSTIQSLKLWDHEELQGVIVEEETEEEVANKPAHLKAIDTAKAYLDPYVTQAKEVSVNVFNKVKNKAYSIAGIEIPDSDATADSQAATETTEPLSEAELARNLELRAIRNFTRRVIVEPVRKTKLIKVSYESADPELAAIVANEIGKQYIASYLASKSEVTATASQWLSRRLTELKSTLAESESRLREFKKENGLVDVDGRVGRLNEQELLLLTTELSQVRSQLSTTSDLYNEMRSLKGNTRLLAEVSAVQADPLVRRIKIEQGVAQRSLDELSNRYGSKHPKVIDATSQLASLNAELKENIDRITESVGKDYKLLLKRVSSIESNLAEGKQEIQEIGSKKFQLDVLEREAATNQKLYDTFFNRYTEAGSAQGLEQANARISEAAVPSPSPVRPRKTLITGVAGLGALVFSIILAFVFDALDKTIKGSRDVEKKLGLKLLGVLPLVKKRRRAKGMPLSPVGHADKAGPFAEAVNATRTALCIGNRSDDYNIILITSSVPNEGKTTSSVNLAYSFGQQERVLLIDGDMRRPSVGKALGWDANVAGLSDLIKGEVSPSECIRRGVLSNSFDVLPAGKIPNHPLELLTTVRFENILSELSKYYDRIIIDSAPVHAVTDALVFSKFSDAVVYVIKSHDTSINIIKRGIDRLEQVDANIVGCLVTQANMNKLASYGGDVHYSGYYDMYGYTEKDNSLKGKTVGYEDFVDDSPIFDYSDFVHLDKRRIRTIGDKFKTKRSSNAVRNDKKAVEAAR